MRKIIALAAAIILSGPAYSAELGDDGLHKTDWYHDTFKELPVDFEDAASQGKRLLVIVEQRGCIYCTEMHEKTFPDPRIDALLHEDYYAIQVNLHGDTELIDTDGEVLTEKGAVRKWGVLFTPTMIFLPTELDSSKSAVEQAVSVMPGAFAVGTTLDMLTWVKEGRYLDQSEEDFQRYHARMVRERNDGNTD